MSSIAGDMEIMNSTVRNGNVFQHPGLNLKLEIVDGTMFQKVTYWCEAVRSAYKAKEDEDEWKAEQESTRGREEDTLRRDNVGGDEGTRDSKGDGSPARDAVQTVEATLEEILSSKLFGIGEQLKVTTNRMDALDREAFTLRDQLEQLKAEEIAVRTAMEVTCGTREDGDSMGGDIHRQVSGEGQSGSGDVGDEDDTSPAPQEVSPPRQGVN